MKIPKYRDDTNMQRGNDMRQAIVKKEGKMDRKEKLPDMLKRRITLPTIGGKNVKSK